MENHINSEKTIADLKETAMDAPCEPGVYIMRGADGGIIYVGKAKNLKNRLKSYFSGEKDAKTAVLLKNLNHIETIIVSSEYDAFLLENTLIKQHSPKYNINLKDGKTYPVIRITHEDFPRIFKTRRIVQDDSLYYGPFPIGQGIDTILELIDKLFPLRKCRTIRKKGPCMYYHIGRCMAPCRGKILKEEYALHVQRVQKLLSGETESLIIDLTVKMHEAAKKLQFEQAAHIRNTIKAIESLTGEDTSVEDLNPEDRDYIAWASEGIFTTYTVFSMRGGKMTGRDLYRTRSAADEWESMEMFITSYYSADRSPPKKIFLQPIVTERKKDTQDNLLVEWFKDKFGYEPELLKPEVKSHEVILKMAQQNAAEDLRKRLKERGAGPAMEELAAVFDLKSRPELIEGFDISHLDGKHPVASLVSFRNGIPDRRNYRYFKLRTVIGKTDDFAAMREVVRRRYSRQIREGNDLPDLILFDGGIGQANAAKGVLDELGITCAIAGLAKREEELWLPGAKKPIVLSKETEALKVLQHVRDESHRFATGLNRRLRSKDLFFSILESVEGIGSKRAAVIMKAYGSISNIAAANPVQIAERCRISEGSARAVRAVARLHLEDRRQK